MKRIIALSIIFSACGLSHAYPADNCQTSECSRNAVVGDNDNVTRDDWRRWCNMEGVKDPLWSCPTLRLGEEQRRKDAEELEHATDWLRGTDDKSDRTQRRDEPHYAPITPGYGVGEGMRRARL